MGLARSVGSVPSLPLASGFAALAGGLTLVEARFIGPAVLLAFLALVVWGCGRARNRGVVSPGGGRTPSPRLTHALIVITLSWGQFLFAFGLPVAMRAALLGGATLILWWLDPVPAWSWEEGAA